MGSVHDDLWSSTAAEVQFDHHGQNCTYRPAVGPERTVVGVVNRVRLADAEEQTAEIETERLWFTVRRDADEGIEEPNEGDTLLLSEDDADSPWSFQGQVQAVTEATWQLMFARMRPTRYRRR